MEAKPTKILDFIGKSQNSQFVIPVYQRMYSWENKHCETLWNDIIRIGETTKTLAHFMGSIMYIGDSHSQTAINELSVIDGQQRLTTLTLLLIALIDILEDEEEILEKFSKIKIKNRYLTNPDEKGEKKYKLILSQTDKDTLISLIDTDKIEPQIPSLRIKSNFEFFKNRLEENKDKLEIICRGIDRLSIIDIALERGKDEAQLIFESMNSTGKDLTQTDLIRNYILMDLEPNKQIKLYEKYWRAMELDFGQGVYEEKFDFFVRHYLTIQNNGKIPNINKIYEEFKSYHQIHNINTEKLLIDLQNYAKFYCAITFKKEQDKELLKAFEDISVLEAEVAFPFLLRLYSDYKLNKLSKIDFIKIIYMIRNYIFRRAVCEVPPNSLNKVFATLFKAIREDNYQESVLASLCLLKLSTRFPNDEEFKEKLLNRDIYKSFKKKNYLLDKLENFNRKEKVDINNYTIEHIMPQNIENNQEWQKALGKNWQEIHEKYLHTLGNLTLTGYNSEYSNKSFQEKRDCEGGFRQSPIILNEMLRNLKTFNKETIHSRVLDLTEKALKIWEYPQLSKEILEKYKPKKEQISYNLQDHRHLQSGLSKELFNHLSREILALDENITQEILKFYIAYKLDTNFVDIIPQARGLKLSINIYLYELDDPKELAKDVTNVGTWGNGKVEVILDSMDNLAYCLGLIRQALEKQQ